MWAGAQLAPGSKITKDKWAPYLASTTKGLFGRTYDAIGFFGHLEDVGVDVWHRILPMTTEASSAGAFDVATGGSATAIDDWPSGLAREPAFGPAWETGGPDIPAAQPPRTKGNVANGTSAAASVGKAANAVVDLDLSADVVIVDATPTARGHLRDAAGTDQLVATLAGRTFCANPNGCACPEGSSGAGIQLAAIAPGKGVLAVTGGTATAKVTVQGKSLADFCKHPTTVDPCVVGTWIGTGVTLDIPSAGITGSGGAGAALKLAKNGAGSVDMNPSAPVIATIPGGLTTSIKLNGGATGFVSAKNGVMTTLATTSSSITFSVDVAGLGSTTLSFSGGSGPPFDGAYTCTKTTLTYTAVGLGGQSTWDRA
jgi:hypothetical protein